MKLPRIDDHVRFMTYTAEPRTALIEGPEEYCLLLKYHMNLTKYLSERWVRFNHGDPMETKYRMNTAQVKSCGITEELQRVDEVLRAYEILHGTERGRVIWGL
jgi:hypothetical protein